MTFRLGVSLTFLFFDEPNNENTNVPHCQCTHKDESFPEPHRPAPCMRNHGMEGKLPCWLISSPFLTDPGLSGMSPLISRKVLYSTTDLQPSSRHVVFFSQDTVM